MAFLFERDDHRPELREGVAETVSFFPKSDTAGNVTVTSASYEVVAPDGSSLQGSSAATITAVDSASYSRVDCLVPAISTIDRGYQIRATWAESGGIEQLTVIPFDVVKWPLGAVVSWNDLLQARPAVQNELATVAAQLGQTPEEYAAMLGYQARNIFDEKLQILVDTRGSALGLNLENRVDLHGYSGRVFLRGHAILDRRRTHHPQVMLALREFYQSIMTGSDAVEDPKRALFERYSAAFDDAMRSLGRIEFDFTDNLVADAEMEPFDGTLIMQRVQS